MAAMPAPTRTTFRVLVLGSFELERDGVRIDTDRWQRRVASLFKLLATAPERRRQRDDVIDALWPDADPEAGMGDLRIAAHRLRRALGGGEPAPILSQAGWVGLSPAYEWEIDLDDFEALVREGCDPARGSVRIDLLEQALSLHRGEPLVEDRYEDWAVPVRERVRRNWREAAFRLAVAYADHKTLASAAAPERSIEWLERILRADPVDEEALYCLLEVLYATGRRLEALRRFRQFEQELADELGVPPSSETMKLVQRLNVDHLNADPVKAVNPGPTNSVAEVAANERPGIDTHPRNAPLAVVSAIAVAVIAAVAVATVMVRGWEGGGGPAAKRTLHVAIATTGPGGSGPGQMEGPSGVTVGPGSKVFVADQGNSRIVSFSAGGLPLTKYGSEGSGPDQLRKPTAVAIGPDGNIYVADYGNRRIVVFTSDGHPLTIVSHWTHHPNAPETFSGVAVDRRGNIYATDLFLNRVVELRIDGSWVAQWGRTGQGPRQFHRPEAITIDQAGNLYVTDTGNNRIQKFSSEHRFIMQFGGRGAAPGQFRKPQGIATDDHGDIFVADTANNRIQELAPNGHVIAVFSRFGNMRGEFNQPSSVAVDAAGNMYVSDYFNNRIVKLSPVGRPIWGSHGPLPGW